MQRVPCRSQHAGVHSSAPANNLSSAHIRGFDEELAWPNLFEKLFGKFFRSFGHATVVVNDRLRPDRYPTDWADAWRVIRLIRQNASAWGLPAKRFALFDVSAGGHLAALEATRPDFYRDSLDDPGAKISARPGRLNPSVWMLLRLYAADVREGPVSAYAVDRKTGSLALINVQAAGGPGSSVAHLVVEASGRMLIAPDYRGGALLTFPLAVNGRIKSQAERIPLQGPPGPDPKWQDHSYPHGVVLSPDSRFALFCDRGLDRIFVFRIDAAHARLLPAAPPFAPAPRWAGPRHGVFSLDGRFLYVAYELGNSISVFAYEADRGAISLRQTIATLPADISGVNNVGEIQIHPNDRFVYASNRGPGSNTAGRFYPWYRDGIAGVAANDPFRRRRPP